ncbi:MAG: HNH endonuclease signature motif containing protein [Fimbriimonadaceae bacterium]
MDEFAEAQFLKDFHDFAAPKLDVYEQAIYLYILRHSRLVGLKEVVIGFKSARTRLACGIGEAGKPMSENTAYLKLTSLASKGFVEVVASEHTGRRLRPKLPTEIPGLITEPEPQLAENIEEIDFFNDSDRREMIFKRDGYRCFYCARKLNQETQVIEHVQSRPTGTNTYRNLVAACRECNNRKNKMNVEDYLKVLYRDGLLDQNEFQARRQAVAALLAGELKPPL